MNSIFLRVYGGLLAVLVLVALLGFATLQLVNQVRVDNYRENLANGTFRLMADNLRELTPVERRRALALWSRLLGVPLQLERIDRLTLDNSQRKQLQRGRVLVEPTGAHGVLIHSLLPTDERLVLSADVQQISEQLARATLYLLIDELRRHPAEEQPQRLRQLHDDKGFGYELRLVELADLDVDDDQRRRIDEGDTVMTLNKGADGMRVLAGIVETPWVLEAGPIYQMNPYPTHLLLLIGAIGLTLIGVITYLLVRQLERRLQGLAAAAAQIASGRLEARVAADDSDAVGRLAGAFNDMAEQLQRLLSIQRELVRAVSHELRTPVARLRFGLEMIADASNDQQRRSYLDGMDGDIQELDKLVDEMLVYARLEQGTPALHFSRLNLRELIEQVLDELAPLRASVHLQVGTCGDDPEQGAWVEAEPRYLRRALQNLVSNAMRHAETCVQVSYQVGPRRCRIDVEDDGPGVPESDWQRLFTPFIRLDDSRTRASGGHGLGLSIVRRIIYWHAGRALVGASQGLGGARFSLIWPRCQEAEQTPD